MHSFLYILKIIYKKRWQLLLIPLAVAVGLYVYLSMKPKTYKSSTTVYTGIVSGYNVVTSSATQDWMAVNNAVDNLISIVRAESTLENVSLRLLAEDLAFCNPEEDNSYLTAYTSAELAARTPQEIKALVVPGDETATFENLLEYFQKDNVNYLKQLFLGEHRHYSFSALSGVEVSRIGNSDMLRISYSNDDQYIVYNTLVILGEEFIKQYLTIRYEQTNDVVAYFERELEQIKGELTEKEDALTDYNVSKGIINYQEQTRMVAERSKDIDTAIEQVSREYVGATQRVDLLEEKMGFMTSVYKNNAAFIDQLHSVSSLYTISSNSEDAKEKSEVSRQIMDETAKLREISSDLATTRYSKEGIANEELISQWLDALLAKVRSGEELKVLKKSKNELASDFKRFSPVGSSIKRQEREISFYEKNYLSNLQGLNEAKLRQKNLQLTSATFRTLTPPTVPLSPEKTKNVLYAVIVFLLVMIFMAIVYVIVEIFNRIPYDKNVGEKLTKLPVIGALPVPRDSENGKMAEAISFNQLGNSVINFLDRTKQPNIINVISMDKYEGTARVCSALGEFFDRLEITPVHISCDKDFQMDTKYYLMATSIYDFGINEDNAEALNDAGVIIVEYPPVSQFSFPTRLLDSSAVTLLVADANKPWKGMDDILLRQLRANDKKTKLALVLTNADDDNVGAFTGMLPPYNFRHRIRFAMYNLGDDAANAQNA